MSILGGGLLGGGQQTGGGGGRTDAQLLAFLREHEAYPWAHSIRQPYTLLPSPGAASFQIREVSGQKYLGFSELGEIDRLFVESLEIRDQFAILDDTTKEELYRGTMQDEFAGSQIPIDFPDNFTLTVGETYSVEFTRGAPDIGQTGRVIREMVVEAIHTWAAAKQVSQAGLTEGEYIDRPARAIPRDIRYADMPISWSDQYEDAQYFESEDYIEDYGGDNVLQFRLPTISGRLYFRVYTEYSNQNIDAFAFLKKDNLIGIFNNRNQLIGFYITTRDWDASNTRVAIQQIFLQPNSLFDYDDREEPYTVKIQAFAPPVEIPEPPVPEEPDVQGQELARLDIVGTFGTYAYIGEWQLVNPIPYWKRFTHDKYYGEHASDLDIASSLYNFEVGDFYYRTSDNQWRGVFDIGGVLTWDDWRLRAALNNADAEDLHVHTDAQDAYDSIGTFNRDLTYYAFFGGHYYEFERLGLFDNQTFVDYEFGVGDAVQLPQHRPTDTTNGFIVEVKKDGNTLFDLFIPQGAVNIRTAFTNVRGEDQLYIDVGATGVVSVRSAQANTTFTADEGFTAHLYIAEN